VGLFFSLLTPAVFHILLVSPPENFICSALIRSGFGKTTERKWLAHFATQVWRLSAKTA
jgi:hypothetical protein